MPLLLNIDTATNQASVCLSKGKEVLAIKHNADQKNHASFIQSAIKELMFSAGFDLSQVHAIAVTAGPGSYTGLRVGLATAKGLCYALKKPLILINTLEVLALAAISEQQTEKYEVRSTSVEPSTMNQEPKAGNLLFCPMIDARRMEVFTALYDDLLQPVLAPTAMILNEESFADELATSQIIFSGDGHLKMRQLTQNSNAFFSNATHDAGHLAVLAADAYAQSRFANIAYSSPFYLKEFFTAAKS